MRGHDILCKLGDLVLVGNVELDCFGILFAMLLHECIKLLLSATDLETNIKTLCYFVECGKAGAFREGLIDSQQ